MITDFFFTIITRAGIQQLRLQQEKFYLIKNKKITEKVIINTEKSRKNFIQEIDYDVGDSVLITSWLLELSNKRIWSFKIEK